MTPTEAIALLTTRRDNARKSGWTDPTLQADVEAYATALDMGIEAIMAITDIQDTFAQIETDVEATIRNAMEGVR